MATWYEFESKIKHTPTVLKTLKKYIQINWEMKVKIFHITPAGNTS